MKCKTYLLIAIFNALFFAMGQIALAATPDKVKVDLFEAHQPVKQIFLYGPARIKMPMQRSLPPGKYLLTGKAGQLELTKQGSPQAIVVAPRIVFDGQASGIALGIDSIDKRTYPGDVEMSIQPKQSIRVRNVVAVKDYVIGVVSSETPANWPVEALKAQAVLTQTRLARHLPSMVLGDSTQRELYLGSSNNRKEVREAVHSVWGQLLMHENRPVAVFYHSTCAGGTSGGEVVFSNKSAVPPYLKQVNCDYCVKSPFSKLTVRRISKDVAAKAFGEGLPAILDYDDAGRPVKVKLPDGRVLSGYQFWILLGQSAGWDKAPGTKYKLGTLPNGDLQVFSTGAGHGVGLCQWGSAELAHQGKTYKDILQYYFPGTNVQESRSVAMW
ncbi:MAG: SpoIID/LytB domain-containing protein [Candidatus Obscuribacterales bacterium]|nr:SpoIID/LytB domain-containing protein [Candidatus Obscuribacterales bacterium]